MTKVVVDTNIIIDYLRIGNEVFQRLVAQQAEQTIELYLSSMSVLELFAGKSSRRDSTKLLQCIAPCTVLPMNQDVARFAGELKRDNNLSIAIADLVIAASALSINAQLATRNKRHYQGIPKLRFYPLS
ncbi:type II toxin-antitoxin system VapC family toxin [Candidatus Gottesmanbacteria bacterium]|nr:type II toxin-antitoxin system VapC family toxin [Candidatus Gottesmanbacteria bacterium]